MAPASKGALLNIHYYYYYNKLILFYFSLQRYTKKIDMFYK